MYKFLREGGWVAYVSLCQERIGQKSGCKCKGGVEVVEVDAVMVGEASEERSVR